MTASDFAAWVDEMKATRNWSKRECARQLSCGINQIARWARRGAPRYIGLACTALALRIPAWTQENVEALKEHIPYTSDT